MARGKMAAKELSPEEKLQQALVPAEEWPYPIPENWCWVRLGSLCTDIQYGYTAKAIFDNNYPKMLRITDIQGGEVDWDNVPNCEITENDFKKYELVSHDIVFARTGATTGKSCFVLEPPKSVYASYLIRIRLNSSFNKKYVYYILQSEVYWKQIMELSSGIAQPGVNAAKLQSLLCPLSPLSEQQRIVDRIESLFAKLDEAKEKAEAVVDGVELRKSAILHKAFTGKLTEWWRKEHGVGLESWKRCLIGEVFDLQAGKNISAKEISSQQTDLYRYPCFGGNGIRGYVEQFNCEGEHPIIGRQGALCGNINLANNQFYATEHAVVVSYKMDVSTPWAYHYLKFLDLNQYATATAQPGLAVSNIVKVPIQYIPFEEQQELSRILDALMNKEQQAKEAAEAVLSQIDTMKKTILARAFRGELGTNDPAEESAVELIKSVL